MSIVIELDKYKCRRFRGNEMNTATAVQEYGIKISQNPNYISNIKDVSEYFLSKEAMTNKKLQKICYYAYSWILTLLNNPEDGEIQNLLFESKFEGWVHGPVCRELYDEYKNNGWNEIPKVENISLNLNDDVIGILDQVWDVYGIHDGNELEDITHQEEPWKESRIGLSTFDPGNTVISDSSIFNYYSKRVRG